MTFNCIVIGDVSKASHGWMLSLQQANQRGNAVKFLSSYSNPDTNVLSLYEIPSTIIDSIDSISNSNSVIVILNHEGFSDKSPGSYHKIFSSLKSLALGYVEEMNPKLFVSISDFESFIQGNLNISKKTLASRCLSTISEFETVITKLFAADKHLGFDEEHSILLIGGGGREHAIALRLAESRYVKKILVAPGNGGTATSGSKIQNVSLAINELSTVVSFAKCNNIRMVVIGPEQPLTEGLVDALTAENIPCFGPTKVAAELEASKSWSKDFMKRHNIRTADYKNFSDYQEALAYVTSVSHRLVIKASGLAAGKGVLLPDSTAEAVEYLNQVMVQKVFGEAGSEVVIEEFLDGEEVSVLAFSDGKVVRLMPGAQDHKRVFDNDEGPNTGGMGAYAPAPVLTSLLRNQCQTILQKVIDGMAAEGREYKGVLYGGFMILKGESALNGPSVLEFNCRFGDPETQVLLPLLETDLFEIMDACINGNLEQIDVLWKRDAFACTVVCASKGYPDSYPKGDEIRGLPNNIKSDIHIFHAGTVLSQDSVLTNGGRVLAITGVADSLHKAVQKAYDQIESIKFDGMHFRRDIASRGMNRPIRLGVLGSTRGSDLQPIIEAIESRSLNAKISVVISNKEESGILERARKYSIRDVFVSSSKLSRDDFDYSVTKILQEEGVDLVLLIGYMRILSASFVRQWSDRCINVHPSLLPSYPGLMDLQVHEAVLAAHEKITGCTIHFVTEEVDGGPIILQEKCEVYETDSLQSLKERVQALEGVAFIKAIEWFRTKNIDRLESSSSSQVLTYKDAGVDIDAGEALVKNIAPFCKATRRSGCDAELGGFGGLFDLAQAGYDASDTVLVSGTDGVGTKLKIAQIVGIHESIGIDLVAMCVNDILVCGAEPLFFLDYYATGALNVEEATKVVKGIAEGCFQSGCALIGGETAEMAGMYDRGEYDLAGFSVGAVRRCDILPRNINSGDILIALRSSGVHSNGYSLVRKCVEKSGLSWTSPAPFDGDKSLAEALLTPTRLYVKLLLPLIKARLIKGLAHITGGGLLDNLPRVLPNNISAFVDIDKSKWSLPPVFKWLQEIANLPQSELLRTFNCGIGMIVAVDRVDYDQVATLLHDVNEDFFVLGHLVERESADSPQVIVKGYLA